VAARCDVLILGAGVAGLACAVALRHAGLRVILIEKRPTPCGRARSCDDSVTGDRVDLGPHILASEYPNLLSMLDTLGTRDRIVWHKNELITLLGRRGPVSMRLSPLPAPLHLLPSLLKVREVSLRDQLSNRRALWLALCIGERELMRLDRIPATEMLRQLGVSRRFTDWFWRSATLSILNVPLEECSGAALMRVFAQLMGHDRYCFGFAAGALDELFWPAASRVLEKNGCELRLECTASALTCENDTCTGALLDDGSPIRATHCVSSLPPAELLQVLPEAWRHTDAFRNVGAFVNSPYISVYHWLDRKVAAHRFWSQTWSPTNLNCDFYDLSNIRPEWAGRPSVIASNIIHSVGLEDLSDEAISTRTLDEIARFAPAVARAGVLHRRIHRIPMAIPCPHPGTESIRPRTETPFAGLLLAGDWTCTSLPACMESAARSGFLAAERILALEGRARSIAKMPAPPQGIAGIVHRMSAAYRE
jgi:15-cis-phytoene desaturase